MADLRREPYGFSLTEGGPFYHLLVRLHVASGRMRVWWLALLTWTPLLLATIVRAAFGYGLDPTVQDLAVHARLLVALPMMMFAEHLVDGQCRGAIGNLYRGSIADKSALERIVARAERWRSSGWAELVILILTIIDTILVLRGAINAWSGRQDAPWRFPRLWYGLVGIPVMQFVMMRWIWRWLIWCHMLAQIARLPLAPIATHPDFAAGLSPVTWPIKGYGVFVCALSTVLAGATGTQLLEGRTTLATLAPGAVAYVVVAFVIGFAPLFAFTGHLYRARKMALADYNDFALDYVRRFHTRWIKNARSAGEVLGTPDLQSLADLGNSFQVIAQTRMFVFSTRSILETLAFTLLPLVPLAASTTTLDQFARKVFSSLMGGLPI